MCSFQVNLGSIQNLAVDDVTTASFTVSWTLGSASNWEKPSFLVTWNEIASRRKREVENQLVSDTSPATVENLKSGTEYRVAVAPYAKAAESSGDAGETKATTKPGK